MDPREKIFIHNDKPYYQLKDTLWLKGYILTATDYTPNDSSRIAYVEIINTEHEIVKRINPICTWGLFDSYIPLNETDYKQGEYFIRAYTNRMRNFGDSLFFTGRFKIIDPASGAWKASIHQLSIEEGRLLLSAGLSAQNNTALAGQTISIRLLSKNKSLFRARVITNPSGNIYIDTLLKDADSKNLQLEISDRDNLKLKLPVKAGEKRLMNIQFFPEGGAFITGKQQRLGFKAVNAFGKGIELKGTIRDSKGADISAFETLHKGMGIVSVLPKAGETYTAMMENGLSFKLPEPRVSGTILQVLSQPGQDSIRLKIDGSDDQIGRWIYFTAASKGIVQARGRIKLRDKAIELSLDKKQFPSGITIVTLYDEQLLPVNSRAVFIWHDDGLKLSITPHKNEYLKKDSVSLKLKVQDETGAYAVGSFSVAVIDTSQVSVAGDSENLLSYMILSSDLRGTIEAPGYYLKHPETDATDALMLTQGWVSYHRVISGPPFSYEKAFTVSGKVVNAFNKALANTSITLFGKVGKTGMFLLDTTTNEKGAFTFNNFPFFETDSVNLVIKALNKRGKAFNVGIVLNEPDYPGYTAGSIQASTDNILVDSIAKQYLVQQEKMNLELKKDGTFLEEVVIKGKVKIQGSKNLNKDGGADQVINESTLDKTPKETLLDVLNQQVKGFRVGMLPKGSILRYMINTNMIRFIIDGVDLEFFYQPTSESSMDYLQYYQGYLTYFSAEDIRGIEVMNYPRYNSAYKSHFLNPSEIMNSSPATIDYSFIEITTRTGAGPFMRKTPGMYLLKPLYPFISKQFYSPSYSSPEAQSPFPDFRTTIYWNPNVITDASGEATISFYTSERNSNYLIVVQGTDLKGGLGVLNTPLVVNAGITKENEPVKQ